MCNENPDYHVSNVLHEKAVEVAKTMLEKDLQVGKVYMHEKHWVRIARDIPVGKNLIHAFEVEGVTFYVVF
jgi:hypothetical protein